MNHFEKMESYIPIDLQNLANWPVAIFVVGIFLLFRYFMLAGPFWYLFYRLRPTWTRSRQIYKDLPGAKNQIFEIRHSLISTVIFALGGVLLAWMWQKGMTKIYLGFNDYPIWYLPLSLIIFSVLHDLYFYIFHRILHWPLFYRRFHSVHHQSLSPSVWASFSFHPAEAMILALAIPLLALVIPIHPVMLLVYLSLMTLSAITNHSGFEILPKGSATHWAGRYLISGLHHAQHHRYFTKNFGLFFSWWDQIFGTESDQYIPEFQKLGHK